MQTVTPRKQKPRPPIRTTSIDSKMAEAPPAPIETPPPESPPPETPPPRLPTDVELSDLPLPASATIAAYTTLPRLRKPKPPVPTKPSTRSPVKPLTSPVKAFASTAEPNGSTPTAQPPNPKPSPTSSTGKTLSSSNSKVRISTTKPYRHTANSTHFTIIPPYVAANALATPASNASLASSNSSACRRISYDSVDNDSAVIPFDDVDGALAVCHAPLPVSHAPLPVSHAPKPVIQNRISKPNANRLRENENSRQTFPYNNRMQPSGLDPGYMAQHAPPTAPTAAPPYSPLHGAVAPDEDYAYSQKGGDQMPVAMRKSSATSFSRAAAPLATPSSSSSSSSGIVTVRPTSYDLTDYNDSTVDAVTRRVCSGYARNSTPATPSYGGATDGGERRQREPQHPEKESRYNIPTATVHTGPAHIASYAANYAPPHTANYAPPHATNYAPPHTANYAPPHATNYAPPHTANYAPPHTANYAPPHATNYAPPHTANYAPPHTTNYAPPHDTNYASHNSTNNGMPHVINNTQPHATNYAPPYYRNHNNVNYAINRNMTKPPVYNIYS